MTRLLLRHVALAALLLFAAAPVRAESIDDFLSRIARAFASDDRPQALKDLFFLDGMDAETLAFYEHRIIGRMLGKYDAPALSLEPLPPDFEAIQVAGDYEYRPNLPPIGYVVFDGNTRVPYGRDGARYYFTGLTRTAIDDPAGPQSMLQMMVVGFGHPPVRYEGWCDILHANRRVMRMTLEDSGHGGNTAIVTAVRIEACSLRKLSAHGELSLTLFEGADEIFQQRTDSPDRVIRYTR